MSMAEWTCNNCGKTNSTQAKYCNCETCPNCGVYHGHDKSCKYYEQPCPSCKELHKANKQFQVLCGKLTFENVELKQKLEGVVESQANEIKRLEGIIDLVFQVHPNIDQDIKTILGVEV